MIEIRRHTYFNKAAIVHVDRRSEFKRKLTEKANAKKPVKIKEKIAYDEKF